MMHGQTKIKFNIWALFYSIAPKFACSDGEEHGKLRANDVAAEFQIYFCQSVTPNNLGLYGHRACTSGIKIDE